MSTLDPTNKAHWNIPKENIAPKNSIEKNAVPDITLPSDDISSSTVGNTGNTKLKERDFLISRAMKLLAEQKTDNPSATEREPILPPTSRPMALTFDEIKPNDRHLEGKTIEELIQRADHLFKLVISTLEAKIRVNKKIIGRSGNEYAGQVIAAQILNYFSGKPAIITTAYEIKKYILEISAISKELSEKDVHDKGTERKKEVWNLVVYKEPKRELERITAIPIPKN